MAVPGFTTVVGPVATDSANGPTGFNAVAAAADLNFPKFNTWAKSAEAAALVTPSTVATGTAVFTPASGWAFEGYSYREVWARKWGGATYVSLAIKRIGASIAVGTNGNLGDTTMGTLAAAYRPLSTVWVTAVCGSGGLYQVYVNTSGAAVLYCASGKYGFPASRSLLWSMLFANTDQKPF